MHFFYPKQYNQGLEHLALVGPGVGVDAAIGSFSRSLMNDFIYFLALFIALRACFSLNFLNFRTRGSKNIDAIRKNPNSTMKKFTDRFNADAICILNGEFIIIIFT
jgi:hypothetical protein